MDAAAQRFLSGPEPLREFAPDDADGRRARAIALQKIAACEQSDALSAEIARRHVVDALDGAGDLAG